MRIGVVSDIHGQVEALDHALGLMGPVDHLFALGDLIDQSRFSAPVIATLRARGALAIKGNHDLAFLEGPGAAARLGRVKERELLAWLAGCPTRAEFELAGRRILLVHATPWPSNDEYVTPTSPSFRRFAEAGADVVLYGHTHQPVVRRMGHTLVVNPGSTGQGRPTDAGFVQSCAILDLIRGDAEILDFVT